MLYVLNFLLGPAIFIAIIVLVVWMIKKRHSYTNLSSNEKEQKKERINISFSREFLFLLSFAFLGVTILALNKDFGDLVSWRTVLFIFSVVALWGAYYYKLVFTVFVGLISFVTWLVVQSIEWAELFNNVDPTVILNDNVNPATILLEISMVFIIFYILGYLHKNTKWHQFNLIYSVLGLLFLTIYMFFLSTRTGIGALPELTEGTTMFSSWQISMVVIALFVFLIVVGFYALANKKISEIDIIAIILFVILFATLAFLPEQDVVTRGYRQSSFNGAGIFWASLFNILIFLELLWITLSGYFKGEKWLINFGVVGFFILIFVKYADWFFDSLHKSIFFLGAGIILFVVGWLMEKGRRYMISTAQK